MSANDAADYTTQMDRASDRELVIRRTFRAKAELVFDCLTRPELMRRWWAPRALGVELLDVTIDLRVGGAYRWVFGKGGKPAMAFNGIYREVDRPRRLVYTQVFEPMPEAGEGLITTVLEEHGGETRFVSNELYPSKAVLDGVLASGMERGMRETLEQLSALLAELAKTS